MALILSLLRHHAERFQRSADQAARRSKIDEAQERLRVLSEQLRLIGDSRVQVAARRVVHHAYAVRVQGKKGEIHVPGTTRTKSQSVG